MAVYKETIQLDDQVSGPAKAAAGAVDNLSKGMAAATSTMAKAGDATKPVGEAMGGLSKSTFDAANAMTVGKQTIAAAFEGIGSAAKALAAGDAKGAVQGLTDAVASMAQLLDLIVPGLGQVVSSVVKIAGGLVGITVGLVQSGAAFAITSSEAKQEMLGLFDAMGQGVVSGEEVEGVIDGLKSKFGISKDAMVDYTKALMAMGRTDLGQLEGDLLAVSSAAALVKGGDQALLSMTKKIDMAAESGNKLKIPTKALAQLSATGANVGDVAKQMGISTEELTKNLAAGTVDARKFGAALNDAIVKKGQGPLEKMANSSANLKKLLSEAWGDLFEDIDVAPFMAEVKKLFEIFGQGTESGKAMKSGIGGFFKEVFGLATKVVPIVKHFLLDMVIYGLKAYLALKPIVKTIREFVTSATGMFVINGILSGIWTVLKTIGAVILVVVGTFIALQVAAFAVGVAIWTAIGAVLGFIFEAKSAFDGWIASAATIAYDFVAGLVGGIVSGAGSVVNAVTGLASAALNAFTGPSGIDAHSPSRKMMAAGGNMTDGAAIGVEDGSADVETAVSNVAGSSVKAMSEGGSSSGAPAASSAAPLTVYVQIDGAGKSASEITEELVASVFQRYALAMGVG